jgi:diacylglycerol kinase
MSDDYRPQPRSWPRKFHDAFRGAWHGVQGQSSFSVHFAAAAIVVAVAIWLRVDRIEWCLLLLCITAVMTAEMFNSALETLAKAVDRQHNLHLEKALNIGSGAVLTAAIGSAVVGLTIFLPRLLALVNSLPQQQ